VDMTWPKEAEDILKIWKVNISKRVKIHHEYMKRYKKIHYAFLIPGSAIGALVGAGLFSLISVDSNDDDCKQNIGSVGSKIFLGILSIIGTVLNSISVSVGFNDISQSHKDAIDSYESLIRIINTTLLLPESFRGRPKETLQTIRELYDRCVEQSPRTVDLQDEEAETLLSETSPPTSKRPSDEKDGQEEQLPPKRVSVSNPKELNNAIIYEMARLNQIL